MCPINLPRSGRSAKRVLDRAISVAAYLAGCRGRSWSGVGRFGARMCHPGALHRPLRACILLCSGLREWVLELGGRLVVAGDYVCALGWERRVASVVRDRLLGVEKVYSDFDEAFRSGVQLERHRREKLQASGPLDAVQDNSLQNVCCCGVQQGPGSQRGAAAALLVAIKHPAPQIGA